MKRVAALSLALLLVIPSLPAKKKDDPFASFDANWAKIKSLRLTGEAVNKVKPKGKEPYHEKETFTFFFKSPGKKRVNVVNQDSGNRWASYELIFDGKNYFRDYGYHISKITDLNRVGWGEFWPLGPLARERAKLVSSEGGISVFEWERPNSWNKKQIEQIRLELDTVRGVVTKTRLTARKGKLKAGSDIEYEQREGAWVMKGAQSFWYEEGFKSDKTVKVSETVLNGKLPKKTFKVKAGPDLPADRGASVVPKPRIVVELEGKGKKKPVQEMPAAEGGALWEAFKDKLPKGGLPAEGYLLETGPKGAVIVAADELGKIRAHQTLRSLGKKAVRIADWPKYPWRGVHFIVYGPDDLPGLKRLVHEFLVPLKCNLIVFQLDYHYLFESHPEVREEKSLNKEQIRDFVELCREEGIRVAPMLNCLGHQSWKKKTHPLLVAYPEFEEIPDGKTPETDINSKSFYCRSWCPLHPEVNAIVFDLMDELIDAFQCELFHIGVDEVFIIASDKCPRCKGKDPAKLFARAVNEMTAHLESRGQTVMIWGDRLLDGEETGYGDWEGSGNGTAPAIDLVDKDIILCDWHYEVLDEYPSLDIFPAKGFRILTTVGSPTVAARLFTKAARARDEAKILGVLSTHWSGAGNLTSLALKGGKKPRRGWSFNYVITIRETLSRAWNPDSLAETSD